MKRVPEVGEVVRVEAWKGGGPDGSRGWGGEEVMHSGDHAVDGVRMPDPGLAPMGWPYNEAVATLRCLHGCPALGLPDGHPRRVMPLDVGVGALRGPHEPTLTERTALREARLEMLAARS